MATRRGSSSPRPARLSTSSVPATRCRRSLMMLQAHVAAARSPAGSKPRPSSATVSEAPPSTAGTRALTLEARACLAMLLNASCVDAVEDDLDVRRQVDGLVDLDVHRDLRLARRGRRRGARAARRAAPTRAPPAGARRAACASRPGRRGRAGAGAPGCARPRPGRAPTRPAAPRRSAWRCRCSASPRRAGRAPAPGAPPRPPASVAWWYRRSISITAASASPIVRASCRSSSVNGLAPASRAMTSAPAGPEVATRGSARTVPDARRPRPAGATVSGRSGPVGDVLGDHLAVAPSTVSVTARSRAVRAWVAVAAGRVPVARRRPARPRRGRRPPPARPPRRSAAARARSAP